MEGTVLFLYLICGALRSVAGVVFLKNQPTASPRKGVVPMLYSSGLSAHSIRLSASTIPGAERLGAFDHDDLICVMILTGRTACVLHHAGTL